MTIVYLAATVVIGILVIIVSLLILTVIDMQRQYDSELKKQAADIKSLRMKLIRHVNAEIDDGK
jgi:uncharacterized membrane-anchored protein YhcB (DUF1043 family)